MTKTMTSLSGIALALTLALTFAASAQADPGKIKTISRGAIDKILEHLGNDQLSGPERRKRVRAAIDGISDMDLLAKLVLGRTHWTKANAAQRAEFTKVFSNTIHLSMYEKLALFSDERVDIGEVEKLDLRGSPKYRVVTWIVSKGTRTELGLLFAQRDEAWRVFDVEIKGVSVRKSYGSQYADYLRNNTMDQLLAEMRRKEAELEAKAKAKESEGR